MALLTSGMIEFIGFDRPLYLAIRLVGDSRIAQAPAPSIAGADMDAQFSRDAPRRTRQAQQKGGEEPVRKQALATRVEGLRQVVERAPTAFAPVAFTSWPIMVGAPEGPVLTLTPRTVELDDLSTAVYGCRLDSVRRRRVGG